MAGPNAMPWNRTNPAKERVKFALEWERRWDAGEGVANVSELCREFGISRETGYVWLRRFRAAGHDVKALEERSHRPHHIPNQIPQDVVDLVVAARKRRPTWGPRKRLGGSLRLPPARTLRRSSARPRAHPARARPPSLTSAVRTLRAGAALLTADSRARGGPWSALACSGRRSERHHAALGGALRRRARPGLGVAVVRAEEDRCLGPPTHAERCP